MARWLTASASVLVASAAVSILAQQPTFRAGINFVSVDAIVADRAGNPVAGLQPQDFDITDQGTPQKIETFKFVALDGGLMPGQDGPPRAIRSDDDERREAARDDVRLFAIFLDDYHVSRAAAIQSRDHIARFIETALGPSDMVGLMYPLTPLSSLLMTRDHGAIVKAIGEFTGRKYDYTPLHPPEDNYWFREPREIEAIRDGVSESALEAVIAHLGDLKDGRKALMLVSEGFCHSPLPNERDLERNQREELRLQGLYNQANRANVSVYWIDPRMLGALSDGPPELCQTNHSLRALTDSEDALRSLTLYTDGRAIIHSNDLDSGLRQIVRDSSAYYLLGYNSTFTNPDGKFHEISVRVKRPGVTVRARKGYWMLTRSEFAAAVAPPAPGPPKAIEEAVNAALGGAGSRLIRTWTGFERGQNGKTRVTFVWDPVRTGVARVLLTASGSDASPYFRGTIETPRVAAFDAPSGKMTLRISLEEQTSRVLDSEVRDVTVPDFAESGTSLPTPRVFRARNARELQALKADRNAPPTAVREFNRTDILLIRTSSSVTAHLLARTGQTLSDLNVAGLDASAEIEIPLSRLAVGDYVVGVDAPAASELIAFRVIP